MYIYQGYGDLLAARNDLKGAKGYYFKGLNTARSLNEKYSFDVFFLRLAQAYTNEGNEKLAAGYIDSTLAWSRINNNYLPKIGVYELLKNIALKENNYKKAFELQTHIMQVVDSAT